MPQSRTRCQGLRTPDHSHPPRQCPDTGPDAAAPRAEKIGHLHSKGNITVHKGECFCGAVHVEVTGEPAAMGYCHCSSCRSWSAGPVNAFTLWNPDAVKITAGAEHVGTYQKTPVSQRQFCKKCGGHIMTNHPPLKLIDVYAATIPTLKFAPGLHV